VTGYPGIGDRMASERVTGCSGIRKGDGVLVTGFVRAEGDGVPEGVGKLVSTDGSEATVEYFNSPTDEPVLVIMPAASLRQIEVPAQTRIYWLDPAIGVWRVGRVVDGLADIVSTMEMRHNSFRVRPLGTSSWECNLCG